MYLPEQPTLAHDLPRQSGAFDDEIPAGLERLVGLIEQEICAWERSDELVRPFAIRLAEALARTAVVWG